MPLIIQSETKVHHRPIEVIGLGGKLRFFFAGDFGPLDGGAVFREFAAHFWGSPPTNITIVMTPVGVSH